MRQLLKASGFAAAIAFAAFALTAVAQEISKSIDTAGFDTLLEVTRMPAAWSVSNNIAALEREGNSNNYSPQSPSHRQIVCQGASSVCNEDADCCPGYFCAGAGTRKACLDDSKR
jgi:hypothetical protein